MTTLRILAEVTGGRISQGHDDVAVTSAAIGSSDVAEGGLFCAVPGLHAHGAQYAASSKAAAVLTDPAGEEILQAQASDLPRLIVDDVRLWMGPVAAEIYGYPARKLSIIGITGTSGKTTTSYLVEKALLAKHSVGIIGTTGTRINGRPIPTQLTTPEAPTMQSLLATMVDEGVTHVVMEVSSHALELGRVRGIDFDVAAFTNLSQDHLDFHPTMEDYFQAKSRLFTGADSSSLFNDAPSGSADTDLAVGANEPEGAARAPHTRATSAVPAAVICVDDEWGQRMAALAARRHGPCGGAVAPVLAVRTTGTAKEPADPFSSQTAQAEAQPIPTWTLDDVHVTASGRQEVRFNTGTDRELEYSIGLAGSFNVANSAVALACVAQLGEDVEAAAQHLRDVQVPGRMQAVDEGQDFLAMVDYAHKPGAVAAVVRTLADYLPSPTGRIGIVIGAGGNRDQDKRPKMGYQAALVADAVFVTDDNPRDEDPRPIREAIVQGAEAGFAERGVEKMAVTLANIADRAEAIEAAVQWAQTGDAIVVAGKGHETGQLVAGVVHEFDDAQRLRAAIKSALAGRKQQINTGNQGGM
ncbi:UDP-N-acetylmuramoyl-L-alanyl-D-glutamate--2,6-diaminopimelate ligase [Corynebacterium auriscanis]|uniref:UDP-N-acetylmuramoyl-L-alanyl-D-glutamate--2,6-diaminopimelate ligase n=1 Tax=Corynebacterium auriscanis TaxID=99807 RepID=A0A0A2DJ05_9CORY|nr:UDP-N-acetylmuramoyl-L-alanyl-D-glutamate--2,6-diaminopimelate ligase [Corynebacterium auriscanis]KGM19195.1 UDP-N-acetylmuramoyl-L-alanyl-D-glutamate--2,6-diaminopimelate ligase [Corynebacterium auriscanis]WJY72475.1 UDP-N-acetylmuramoyl-L-alanyl-D-glutamate--2,6-diaminopimelate ligase [Corynebacterium auriscanis]